MKEYPLFCYSYMAKRHFEKEMNKDEAFITKKNDSILLDKH